MGRALVEAAKSKGHTVTAVECPKDAESATKLLVLLKELAPKCDVLIMTAAVCDMRPKITSKIKIKKDKLSKMELVKNPDILAQLAKTKKKGQVFTGFALESSDLGRNGRFKMKAKGLDLIVVQKVSHKEKPFGEKEVDFMILSRQGEVQKTGPIAKTQLARILIARTEAIL